MSTKIAITVTVETHDRQTITHTSVTESFGDNPAHVAGQVQDALDDEGRAMGLIITAAHGRQYGIAARAAAVTS